MTFSSLEQYYSGSWMRESSSQGYAQAVKIVQALEQGQLKEYPLANSSGKILCKNGFILDKNGVLLAVPYIRAQYIIGDDLTKSLNKGKDIIKEVSKLFNK